MTLTPERIAELKRLAEAAEGMSETGNWEESGWASWFEALNYGLHGVDDNDRKYVETFNPQTALELIGEIGRLGAELNQFSIHGSDGCLNCETGRINIYAKKRWCLECQRKKERP